MAKKTIDDLREVLFETLEGLKAGKVDTYQARTINEIARTLCDTARVEVAYLQATGAVACEFLGNPEGTQKLPPGVTGITRHRLPG